MSFSRVLLIALLLAGAAVASGCNAGFSPEQFNIMGKQEALVMQKVTIHFENQEHIEVWVSDLGISADEDVYSGGSSRCFYYDEDGNVAGVFNYQKVTFIEKME